MKKIVKFVAKDGMEFEDECKCQFHEDITDFYKETGMIRITPEDYKKLKVYFEKKLSPKDLGTNVFVEDRLDFSK